MAESSSSPRSHMPDLGLVLGLGSYYILLAVLRLVLSSNLEPDDADLALFSQSLAWGYSEQPPLYSWLVWSAVQFLGVGIVALTLVKTLSLLALHAALYAAGREMTTDRRLVALATASPLLISTYFWNSIAYLTHTVLACAAAVALFAALARLRSTGRLRDGLLLGLVVGLGLLTKYNVALVVAALGQAALLVPSYRVRLISPAGGLAIVVALVVLLPHLGWLAQHREMVHANLAGKAGLHQPWHVSNVTAALGLTAANLLLSVAPLLICVVIVLPLRGRPVNDHLRLLAGYAVFIVLEMVLLMSLGTNRLHERWLQPILALAPLVVVAAVNVERLSKVRVRWFAGGLTALGLGLLCVRASQVVLGGADRGIYPLQMDFAEPARVLAREGFDGATLVCHDRELAGNLRVCFPKARVLCCSHVGYLPPVQATTGRCFLIWNTVYGLLPPEGLANYVRAVLPAGRLRSEVRLVDLPAGRPGRRLNQIAYGEWGCLAPRSLASMR